MSPLTDDQRRHLDEAGYLHLPGVLPQAKVLDLLDHLERLWAEEGATASAENYVEPSARRLANLANKGDLFRPLFAHPVVLAAAEQVMGPAVRLSMLNARDAKPGESERQPFHADTDNAGRPDAQGFYACTAIWMLDPFTRENGATRLVPGSHRSGKVPKDVMADIFAPHPDEIALTGERGDLVIFNGHCWHAGGPNRTDQPRRALLAHYLRADIPRPANRRQHLDPAVRARLTARERDLLGLDE